MECAGDVQWLANRVDKHPNGDDVRVVAMIESSLAILNVHEICTSHPRLDALIFGADDLAAQIGAT